jgi:hypothetical protein
MQFNPSYANLHEVRHIGQAISNNGFFFVYQ